MDAKYYPYGDRLESQGNLGTDKLFTGQRLDDTGLYYYGARYYDPTIGRFISADPVIKSMANPQNFNRYSYVLNNPLKYVDPSGLIPIGVGYRDDESYIIDEQDGQYRVVGTDLTASGWYSSQGALEEAWGGYIEQYGGGSPLDYWEDEGPHEILVTDKSLYDKPIKVTLVPEGSGWANILSWMGAGGQSNPLGNFVRYELDSYYNDVEKLVEAIRHEWFHDYERKTQWGFDIGYAASIVGSYEVYDFRGKTFYQGPHNAIQDEAQARAYSGAVPHPWGNPEPWPFWKEGVGKAILDWLRVDY